MVIETRPHGASLTEYTSTFQVILKAVDDLGDTNANLGLRPVDCSTERHFVAVRTRGGFTRGNDHPHETTMPIKRQLRCKAPITDRFSLDWNARDTVRDRRCSVEHLKRVSLPINSSRSANLTRISAHDVGRHRLIAIRYSRTRLTCRFNPRALYRQSEASDPIEKTLI